ncbi:MAG: bifunctional DNA-formamidopyrimidine glycosylase/DNA-(apurinic or apyrimidinic site) lyase [Patescibacteria group bacterium]|nr:bifunctional DNA-formamidopyrimidine glycosylase/DNA-(apurinic or apyrimidinic site) lyase [Patescibacteria group bacterium]
MPELPEVETLKRQLEKVIKNQQVLEVQVLREKSFQGAKKEVVGKKIKGVERRAKLLIIALEGSFLVVHLKMTGQLVYVAENQSRVAGGHPTADWVKELPSKHTRVILRLEKGTLFFNDQRVFGWIKVVKEQELRLMLAKFGPDIISKEANKIHLKKILASSGRMVKLILMDQTKIGGLGNIYVNDGLFYAGIDPKTRGKQLAEKSKKLDKLFIGLKRVVGMGIRYQGASETNYVHLNGMGGKYQEHFLVYKKTQCTKCRGRIKRISLGGRSTYYCPKCQI